MYKYGYHVDTLNKQKTNECLSILLIKYGTTFKPILHLHFLSVQPVFIVNPEDKVRLEGQSLSLCCSAIGKPHPTLYKW